MEADPRLFKSHLSRDSVKQTMTSEPTGGNKLFLKLLVLSSQKHFFSLSYPFWLKSVLFDQLGRILCETLSHVMSPAAKSLEENYNSSSQSPKYKRFFHASKNQ